MALPPTNLTSIGVPTPYTPLQLGLVFPPPGGAALPCLLDTAQHDETALQSVGSRDTYPLVIRLESVSERGVKEGHTLEVGPAAASTCTCSRAHLFAHFMPV
jgi:hypothetical protein